jgi:hypothetical protein
LDLKAVLFSTELPRLVHLGKRKLFQDALDNLPLPLEEGRSKNSTNSFRIFSKTAMQKSGLTTSTRYAFEFSLFNHQSNMRVSSMP